MKPRLILRQRLACMLGILIVATVARSQTNTAYHPAANFSWVSNPHGVWSLGYSSFLGGPMTLYTDRVSESGLHIWRKDILLGDPLALHNPTPNAIDLGGGSPHISGNGFALHPGPNNEYSIARFTAPSNGTYRVRGSFSGADKDGTSTDVHLLRNSVRTFDGMAQGFGPGSGPAFHTNVALAAGDRLDFAVGYGTNQSFAYDMTGLEVWISDACWPVTFVRQPQSTSAPAGGSITLSASVDGTAPFDYQWLHLGTTLVGGNAPTLTISSLSPGQVGSYYLTVLNCWGLRVWSSPAFVSMAVSNSLPQITREPTNTTVWERQNARFDVGLVGSEPLAIEWTHNGRVIPNTHQPSLLLSNVTFDASGVYRMSASNAYGTLTSQYATLNVLPYSLPALAITGPLTNSSIVVPANLTMQVSANAAAGEFLGVQLFMDQEAVAPVVPLPGDIKFPATQAGLHTLSAVATTTNGVQIAASIPMRFVFPPLDFGVSQDGGRFLELAIPMDVRSIIVDESDDLQQWRTVTNATTSGPLFNLTVPAGDLSEHRFYRVKYFLP